MKPTDTGFEIIRVDLGAKPAARFRCVECGETLCLAIAPTDSSADGLAKRAERFGWRAHAYRKSLCYCPKCSGPKKPKSEPKKVMPMAVTPTKQPDVREPTTDERTRIRNLLDKHFDDKPGLYLDDMSDQRIAEMVGVPRVIVERIREVGYGPNRTDPVIAGLRNDLAALKREIEGQQKGIDGLKAKADEMVSRIEQRAVNGKGVVV
jgi:hypothetical protein